MVVGKKTVSSDASRFFFAPGQQWRCWTQGGEMIGGVASGRQTNGSGSIEQGRFFICAAHSL